MIFRIPVGGMSAKRLKRVAELMHSYNEVIDWNPPHIHIEKVRNILDKIKYNKT